ncbi:MAG: class I SAM-dependent methyltransferase [Verrucomicrobiales bacterium]
MPEQDYQSLEARWHDLFWSLEGEAAELPLLSRFLATAPAPALYLGSGSGRLLAPLLTENFDITGLEPSAEMRSLCERTCPEARVMAVSWEEAELSQSFGSVLVPAFTFQLFAKPLQALRKMASALQPDGRIYLSLFFPWAELLGDLPAGKWYRDAEASLPDGTLARLDTRFQLDEKRGLLRRRHLYRHLDAEGGELARYETRQRIHWFTDLALQRLLDQAGLVICQEILDFDPELDPEAAEEPASVITLILKCDTTGN